MPFFHLKKCIRKIYKIMKNTRKIAIVDHISVMKQFNFGDELLKIHHGCMHG